MKKLIWNYVILICLMFFVGMSIGYVSVLKAKDETIMELRHVIDHLEGGGEYIIEGEEPTKEPDPGIQMLNV